MTYVDKYGLWNTKPVVNGEPSGNDGPIITAYAQKLGFSIDYARIREYFNKLEKIPGTNIPLERLPGKKTPYPSRDSILGWYWLGLLSVSDLIKHDWNFSPMPIPSFNLIELAKDVKENLGKDRNYYWKNDLDQIYRFAFSVPIQDRAYMLDNSHKKVPFAYTAYTIGGSIFDRKTSDSSQLIGWRKGDKKLDIEVFRRYFGADHDFVKRLEYRV